MNRLCILLCLPLMFTGQMMSQIKLQEGFESGTLPSGWGVWNESAHPVLQDNNWTVRSVGEALPGIGLNTAVSHSGSYAIGVGWQSGLDTSGGQPSTANAWLTSRGVPNIQAGDALRFWGTGGGQYADTLQIWVSTVDSTPATQSIQLGTLVWPVGATFGQFTEYTFDLAGLAGQNIWIGFRYYLNASTGGYFVHVDDIRVEPLSAVDPRDGTLPGSYALQQNFPNPFNPSTIIDYQLPSGSFVSLKVYTLLGKEVATLVHEVQSSGFKSVKWDASGLSSGVYFYRLIAGNYSESRKMVLTR